MTWKTSILLLASKTAQSPEVFAALRERAAQGPIEIMLVVPAEGSDRRAAQEIVDAALAAYRDAGIEAVGEVGDSDPIIAITERWDPRRFDEILVSTLPVGTSKWLAADTPHRISRLTDCRVTHIESQPPRILHVEQRERTQTLGPLDALTSLGRGPSEGRGDYVG